MATTYVEPANDRSVVARPHVHVWEKQIQRLPGFEKFIGASESILQVLDHTKRAAETDSTVLIRGESGTGKELIADAIHLHSSRGRKPQVVVNIQQK